MTSMHPAILKAKAQAKEKMSITQTFVLAHKARSKLSKEASKPDHDLRHLVLTANLLDSLMLQLSKAEEDQEAWFNGMVREDNHDGAEIKPSTPSLDAISEDSELAWTSEDYSDSSDSDSDDDDVEDDVLGGYPMLTMKSLSSSPSYGITIEVTAEASDEEDDDSDDEEDDGFYSLRRMPSRAPSLIEDSSDSDEEDSSPPSPQHSFAVPALTEKERQSLVTTSFYEDASTEEESSPISYLDSSIHIQRSASLIAAY